MALQPAELASQLGITRVPNREFHVAGCSALLNQGVKVRPAWGEGAGCRLVGGDVRIHVRSRAAGRCCG